MSTPSAATSSSFSPDTTGKRCDAECQIIALLIMLAVGSEPPAPILSAIMHELQKLSQQNNDISRRIAALEGVFSQRCNIRRRMVVHDVSAIIECQGDAGDAPVSGQSELAWICPVCLTTLCDRDSFKGHIRSLAQHACNPHSWRRACHMNPLDANHQALSRRFVGANFRECSQNFCVQYYQEVRCCTSSYDTEEQSHRHLSEFISWCLEPISNENHSCPVYDASCRPSRKLRRVDGTSSSSSQSRSRSRPPHDCERRSRR